MPACWDHRLQLLRPARSGRSERAVANAWLFRLEPLRINSAKASGSAPHHVGVLTSR